MKRYRIAPCGDCAETLPLPCRGLCSSCYSRHHRNGTLGNWPRLTNDGARVIEDTNWLLDQGVPFVEIGRRLGMKPGSINTAFRRAGLPAPGPWVAS